MMLGLVPISTYRERESLIGSSRRSAPFTINYYRGGAQWRTANRSIFWLGVLLFLWLSHKMASSNVSVEQINTHQATCPVPFHWKTKTCVSWRGGSKWNGTAPPIIHRPEPHNRTQLHITTSFSASNTVCHMSTTTSSHQPQEKKKLNNYRKIIHKRSNK